MPSPGGRTPTLSFRPQRYSGAGVCHSWQIVRGRSANVHAEVNPLGAVVLACRFGLWHPVFVVLDPERIIAMSLPIEVLEAEVLRLPTVERARLLDRIVASLGADKARDEAWDQLAAKRDAEIESGAATPVSGPDAIARLRAELL